ncbi:MAG: tetratricopeptide repeat protein [Hyphomicrobiaceae bacterium]|nr:tetratricopeptide repeat protein [Hyphomicrobiaceae bacterium]
MTTAGARGRNGAKSSDDGAASGRAPAGPHACLDAAEVVQTVAEAQALFDIGEYEAAIGLWLPLAQEGFPTAQNAIGMCLIGGLGAEADATTGAKWLRAAAAQGDAAACRNLADCYLKGEGVPQTDAEAEAWYRRAAAQGDGTAQDMLSWLLANADGREPDYAESMTWATAAAAQGNAASMTRIGLFHHNALGVPRDAEAAVGWWQKAARLGEPDGQAMLGAAYHIGQGVPRDPVRAYAWLRRARWGKSKLAERFIYAVRASLSEAEIAAAEALAEMLSEETPLEEKGAS